MTAVIRIITTTTTTIMIMVMMIIIITMVLLINNNSDGDFNPYFLDCYFFKSFCMIFPPKFIL